MTKKPLEWTRSALDDFSAQLVWVYDQNIIDPERVRQRVERTLGLIASHSGIGTPGRRAGTREWPVKDSPLTLVYRVFPEKVSIVAVVHQRANYRG